MYKEDSLESGLLRAFGKPTKKQEAFLIARTRFIGYGGAKGGGKSHAIRAKATFLAYYYPGIQMLIVRRTYPELRENHTKRLKAAYAAIPPHYRPEYSEREKAFSFPHGSRLKLGYCSKENDVLQYQGQEYDVIFIDEATQLTEYQFSWLCACVRGANNYPKRAYITCNPGGVGHAWVKRLFIDRDYKYGENARDYTFIQARVYDNAPLFNSDKGYRDALAELKKKYGRAAAKTVLHEQAMQSADYIRQLQALPPMLRRAWLEGDWNVFAGQFFCEFNHKIHVCKPFALPQNWHKSAAIDYGLDMLAVLWFAVDENGRAYCYRSIEQSNLTVSEAAQAIKESQNETVEQFIAPPDLWSRRQDTGCSAAEIFAQNGVPLLKAGSNRIDGWLNVKEYLRIIEGQSRLVIFSTCAPLLRCLPLLQHDRIRAGDVANEPHDITHSPDALRYWCSRRALIPCAAQTKLPEPFADYAKPKDELESYLLGGFD